MEIRLEIERWKQHFQHAEGNLVVLDDLDSEVTERLIWWHMFLAKIGEITPSDAPYT